jgi:hypothetical protein
VSFDQSIPRYSCQAEVELFNTEQEYKAGNAQAFAELPVAAIPYKQQASEQNQRRKWQGIDREIVTRAFS